jgi:hypothetical protein
LPLLPQHSLHFVMQQEKVLSCIAVKVIYASVWQLQNVFQVFETLFQSVRR